MLPERFWDKVLVGSPNECWTWIAHHCQGYGHVRVGRKIKKAHRLSYEEANGPIPKGKVVMHKCDNRACVNPAHLTIGTIGENNKDRDDKGRHVALAGEAHGNAKLIASNVMRIRELKARHRMEIKNLAKELGISESTITDVANKRTWKALVQID